MFVILLRFSEQRSKAAQLMDAHKQWIKRGFDDGVFILAGSLQTEGGGAILAHRVSPADLQQRVQDDPFVAENVVRAEIIEIKPSRIDERLAFLDM